MDSFGQPLIAVRIKDGIFVGNVTAAHDEDFLYMNKVTHIVNCSGSEVNDLYEESLGIKYLTFPWKDSAGGVCTTVMFDSGDRNIDQAVRFIDQCLDSGECVLVHSYYGVSRSCALVCAYLMVKYGWRIENALQFLTMAHPDINIKPYFLRQLRTFAKRHNTEVDVFHENVDDGKFGLDNDQWMLRNTLLNGLTCEVQQKNKLYKQCAENVEIRDANYKNPMKRRRRLVFTDTRQGTGVAGAASTPVVQPRPHHVDPLSGNFSGRMGIQGLKTGQQEVILARQGVPNCRKLESQPELQPKGRQVLYVKQPAQPEPQAQTNAPQPGQYPIEPQQRQQQQSHLSGSASGGGGNLTPRGRDPTAHQPIRSNNLIPGTRTSMADNGGGGPEEVSQNDRLMSGQQHKWTPNSGTIRSPFSISHNSSAAVRKGSPLPQQRRTTTTASGGGSTTSRQQQQQPAQQPLRYASPQAIPSLSAVQNASTTPTSAGGARTGLSSQTRGGSPMSRGAPQVRGGSPMSRTGLSSSANNNSSSSSPSMIKRTSSPMSRVPNASATISHESLRTMTGGGGSGSTTAYGRQNARANSPMTQQRRAASPLSGPGYSSGGYNASPSSSSTSYVRNSSPMQRTRNDSPSRQALGGAGSASGGTRLNSPRGQQSSNYYSSGTSSSAGGGGNRASVSLAEQYLGMGPVTNTGSGGSGVGGSRIARDTNASILRRQQGSISAHR